MPDAALPPSRLVGPMIEKPTPCGLHVIRYPAALAQYAQRARRCSVFLTMCGCNIAYLVATQPNGTHFRAEGPRRLILDRYKALPWPEREIVDRDVVERFGVFAYKAAPSVEAIDAALNPPA